MSIALLRYVAVYCLLDGVHIVFLAVLRGAGDVWRTMRANALSHDVAIAAFGLIGPRLRGQWLAAAIFICSLAGIWSWRVWSRRWESARVTVNRPAIGEK